MLVLERSPDDGFRVGSDVHIRVLEVSKSKVLLGIDAPRQVPIVRDEAADSRLPHDPDRLRARTVDRPFHVLLIEDDANHRLLIGRALDEVGRVDLESKETGQQGIDHVVELLKDEATLPDLIIVDLMLPDMTGPEVITALRERLTPDQPIPICVFSSHADSPHTEQSMQAGANAVFAKPASYGELRTTLKRVYDFWATAQHVHAAG